jgi:hypothetical protein
MRRSWSRHAGVGSRPNGECSQPHWRYGLQARNVYGQLFAREYGGPSMVATLHTKGDSFDLMRILLGRDTASGLEKEAADDDDPTTQSASLQLPVGYRDHD